MIEPLLPKPLRNPKGGRPKTVNVREVINTILHQCPVGWQWDMLPHDLLTESTVYDCFKRSRDDGTLEQINDVLVGATRSIEASGEECDPSAESIDSQAVKASERSSSRGYDGDKKITGRKRSIAVDKMGILLAVLVTVASLDDGHAARPVMRQLMQTRQPRLEVVWAVRSPTNMP